MLTESKHALAGWLKQPVKTCGNIETSQAQKSAAQHVRKQQQREKAWWEPGPFLAIWSTHVDRFPRESLLESCSREDNGVRGRSAWSPISARLLVALVVIHILRFVAISSRKESFGADIAFLFCLEGRNARRTEELHRGGAGKGEDRVLTL